MSRRSRYARYPGEVATGGPLGGTDLATQTTHSDAASQFGYSQRPEQLSLAQQQRLRSEVDQALGSPNALQNLTEIMRRNPDILATVPGLAERLRTDPNFQQIREQLMTNLGTSPNPLASGTQAADGTMAVDPGQQQALIRHLGALGPRTDGASLQHERVPRALHAPAR